MTVIHSNTTTIADLQLEILHPRCRLGAFRTRSGTRAQQFQRRRLHRRCDLLSGAAVERSDLQGRFLEVLEMTSAAADLSEFIGAPVLDAHNRTSSRSIYGNVSAARIDSGRGLATIQLSRTADAAPIVDRIREGTLRNVTHRLSGVAKPRGSQQRAAHADCYPMEAEGIELRAHWRRSAW